MPAKLIDGRAIAEKIRAKIKAEVDRLGFRPGLGVILVGDDPASHLYVRLKEKACREVGLRFEKAVLPASAPAAEVLAKVAEFNRRDDTDAFIIQLPLPPQMEANQIIPSMDPSKDADGFHQDNLDLLLDGRPRLQPVLPAAVMAMLAATGQEMRGKGILVISNSPIFFAPLCHALKETGAEGRWTDPDDRTLPERLRQADVVVVAVGRAGFIRGEALKPGATVIDIGTNRTDQGGTVGDADAASVASVADWLTPVPGGIGPVTVAMLLRNVVILAKERRRIQGGA